MYVTHILRNEPSKKGNLLCVPLIQEEAQWSSFSSSNCCWDSGRLAWVIFASDNCCLGVSFVPPQCKKSSCFSIAVGALQLLLLSICLYRTSHPSCSHLHTACRFLSQNGYNQKASHNTVMSNAKSGVEGHLPSILSTECAYVYVCMECWEVGQRGKYLTCVIDCLWKTPDWQKAECTQHGRSSREASRHWPSSCKEKLPTQWESKIYQMNEVLHLFTIKRKGSVLINQDYNY